MVVASVPAIAMPRSVRMSLIVARVSTAHVAVPGPMGLANIPMRVSDRSSVAVTITVVAVRLMFVLMVVVFWCIVVVILVVVVVVIVVFVIIVVASLHSFHT